MSCIWNHFGLGLFFFLEGVVEGGQGGCRRYELIYIKQTDKARGEKAGNVTRRKISGNISTLRSI